MKKILIPNINNKLYNNLSLTRSDYAYFMPMYINKNIYNIYYQNPFDIFIIPYSIVDNSIIQFCLEYPDIKKIIQLDTINYNLDFINTYKSVFTFLIKSNDKISANSMVIPDNLINDQILESIKSLQLTKKDYIACFLDEIDELPKDLEKYLYPNTSLKIRMFNNPHIKHIQNLGMLNEIDKIKILSETQGYLALNDLYKNEALLNNCRVFTIESLSQMKSETNTKIKYNTYTELLNKIIS